MKPASEVHGVRRVVFLVAVLSSAGYAVRALSRGPEYHDEPQGAGAGDPVDKPVRLTASILTWGEPPKPPAARRAAVALAVTTLFFAGAAVTAGAGDEPARLLEETTEPATTTTESAEAAPAETPAEAPPAEPASEPAPAAEVAPAPAPEAAPAVEVSPVTAPAEEAQPARSSSARPASSKPARAANARPSGHPQRKPNARPKVTAAQEAAAHGGASVIWLNRALPDPTPRARRVDRMFIRSLVQTSRRVHVDWALVLGVLRAEGHRGRVPATLPEVQWLARRLRAERAGRDAWAAALAVTGSTDLADKAVALARFNRAVGTEALVRGLAARRDALVERLLGDDRVEIYAGGRDDLTFGRIDVRVVALIAYLAESFGQVSVSCLFSGHRLYARPGVVSAHVYGHAVDIGGLGGVSITGHQEPGGLTEHAVSSILLLPAELQPRQVISLLGLGGASFPLADHHDHIHVGY
jgi:hypothetical protein